MRIMVSLCTADRDASLATCLDALGNMYDPKGGYEVEICVTVNEAEVRAATAAVIVAARATGRFPVTMLHEPLRGIPFARNRGLEHALDRGFTHVAFIDDDAWPEEDWIEVLASRMTPRHCAVAGPQVPVFPQGTDSGLARSVTYMERVLADGAETDWAATNNALVDLAPVRDHAIRFDPDFAPIGGEDSFFFRQIVEKSGKKIAWAAGARVHEPVVPDRLTWKWALSRSVRNGMSDALVMRKCSGRAMGAALALRRFLRVAAAVPSVLAAAALGRRPFADAILRSAYAYGCLAGALRPSRQESGA